MIKHIAITMGEPAGIGPELIIKFLQEPERPPLAIIGDRAWLEKIALQLNLQFHLKPNDIFISIPLIDSVIPGKLSRAHAPAVIKMLEAAAQGALEKRFLAIVTCPIHKGNLRSAGFSFTGHTEFFADYCKIKKSVMMLMNDKIRIALVTTHLPLRQVPEAITSQAIEETVRILYFAFQKYWRIREPKFAVCGLNPHAGENGTLGREEVEIIIPSLEKLRSQGISIWGTYSADTFFLKEVSNRYDALIAMYHDQALPVVKYADFKNTVNITLGLPFIRTSPDHGTALDIAGSGQADVSSLKRAVEVAAKLAV